MSKKYQKNTDPDSSEEENEIEPLYEQSLNKNLNQTSGSKTQSGTFSSGPTPAPAPASVSKPKTKPRGRPEGAKTKDPAELVFTQEQINDLILQKYGPKYKEKIPLKDIKKLVPPKPKYIMTDDDKERLRQQLERGRETIKRNKELKKQQQAKEIEEMRKKSIIVPNPRYVKKQKKELSQKVQPPGAKHQSGSRAGEKIDTKLYPSNDESESETTDTREIRRTKEKIKLIQATTNQVKPVVPVKQYHELSILEKLKSKF
jgi:hypothetical protein